MKMYRLLTGEDNSDFCARVERVLNEGWTLHGSPSITFDSEKGRVICAQAVVKQPEINR